MSLQISYTSSYKKPKILTKSINEMNKILEMCSASNLVMKVYNRLRANWASWIKKYKKLKINCIQLGKRVLKC